MMLIILMLVTGCVSSNSNADDVLGDVETDTLLAQYPLFSKEYQSFDITQQQTARMKEWPAQLTIDVYFGTWCHDSQREVPRLLKALAANTSVELNLIALDYQKSEPEGRAKRANVKYTPTFVVSLSGKEIGRIIERPKISLVDDISNMLE